MSIIFFFFFFFFFFGGGGGHSYNKNLRYEEIVFIYSFLTWGSFHKLIFTLDFFLFGGGGVGG